MQDEVNQDYSEQNEVDGMKKGADSTRGRHYHVYHKVLQNLVKQFIREYQSIYQPFVLDETTNRDFSEPNTVSPSAVVLTDFT